MRIHRSQIFIAFIWILVLAATTRGRSEEPTLDELKAIGARKSSYQSSATPSQVQGAPEANLDSFRKDIGPLLEKACAGCHGAQLQEANFRVDKLDPDLIQGKDRSWWLEVMNVVSNAEMPPADAEYQLVDKDRTKIVDWLSAELQSASLVARGERTHSSFRRMTRYEYNYALQDLLGLPYDFASDLPPETPSEDGFQNSSEMLHISAVQLSTYRELARKALLKATVKGDQPEPVYYSITMDEAADLMRGIRRPVTRKRDRGKNGRNFNAGAPHFVNLKSGEGVNGRYSYGGARYSWRPVDERPEIPELSQHVFVLTANGRQILDLGDTLPDTGILRLRMRACRTSDEGNGDPELRVSFGFQASNNSQAAFPVGDLIAIDAAKDSPKFYELEIPLGEVSRNPYRGNMELGRTPNPSEYLVFHNLNGNRNHGGIQIDYIEIIAPFYQQWPPESHRRIFFDSQQQDDESAYAREVLTRFMTRAWRREVTPVEVERKLALFEKLRPTCGDFHEAMIEVLASVLSSPRFLYVSQADVQKERLGDFQLATRLSMFLWSSMPDDELLEAAADGRLKDSEELLRQTERILQDPKAKRFSKHFVRQWLGMQLLDYLKIDEKALGRFDDQLRAAMQQEPIAVFEYILANNLSVMDFLHADFTMVNERLARHYGMNDVYGSQFRKVALQPQHHRGGVLTQAGLLAMNSDGKDSHPLKRGIWLLEKLLHDPPPPPPPAVPEIDLTDPEILKLTLKERMEDHRRDPACMSCHARIDPWGVAFENFNALGGWRDRIGNEPVDASSVLFNGQKLDGMDGLK